MARLSVDHSYEEIRSVALDILAGRVHVRNEVVQHLDLEVGIAEILHERENIPEQGPSRLSYSDCLLFDEVFWDLFRQGIITLGYNEHNRAYPHFRLSSVGKRILDDYELYFFHDVSTYETCIKNEIPDINEATLIYLKEAMQAFRVDCTLSSSVMLGVATEHTFNLLLETVEDNPAYAPTYASVNNERTILRRVNKFKEILDQQRDLPRDIKEGLSIHFTGILDVIRNFRNESGHPSGKIISREQCYVLLHLFISYGKKAYQLKNYYRAGS